MIASREWTVWVICLTSLCSLLICCNKPSQGDAPSEVQPSASVEMPATQPEETQVEQEEELDPQQVPIAEDFEDEAEATVREDNYRAELDRLAKEIERE